MNFASNVTELIGTTPMVKINHVVRGEACLLAKLEMRNPGGSVKDRIAYSIIKAAQSSGKLVDGGTIVEATSGNTGVGLAMVGAALGYRVVLAMPESMSLERRVLTQAYGARLLLTPASEGMAGAVKAAKEYVAEHPEAILASQFTNPANPKAHYDSTAQEIWRDTDGKVDAFIAGVGTGGTVSGVGKFLKEQNPAVRIIAVEPSESPLLGGGKAGPHGIQGIGANFIPETYDSEVVDEVIQISTDLAIETAQLAASQEGLMVGISGGANLQAAIQVAARPNFNQATIVTLLPDTGERYVSTPLYSHLKG